MPDSTSTSSFGTTLLDYLTTPSGIGAILGGIGALQNTRQPVGYQGKIPTFTATRAQIPVAQPTPRVYGSGAVGRQYFTPMTYTKTAAKGGIMSLASGGLAEGGFVIPADVVSHLGNGSSSAGLALLASKLGAAPVKGDGDGMSDSIPTTIDGERPAKVANDEAYLAPEKVAALGGGDAKRGAKKLYALMDRIREERTGTKKQGKQIDPSRFLPSDVPGYDGGGGVTGAAVNAGLTGTESNLSNWAGDYVTNMLGQGAALANQPYQAYTGPLTAGTSPLSQLAYDTASTWGPNSNATDAASKLGQLSATNTGAYTPSTFTSQYNAPAQTSATNFTNQYSEPATYNAGHVDNLYQNMSPYTTGQFTNQFQNPLTGGQSTTNFTNQYQAPGTYNGGNFSSGIFDNTAAQQYMSPYLQQSLAPQIAEAKRQADIQALQDKARLVKAGAYGGSRQAIMESEGNRNLMQNLANITGQGYNTAYTNAMNQFNADQGRNLQAQQMGEQSRQFGANQAATAAQLQAQYGLSAQQAQEAARQFNAGQALSAAQLQAQYGLSAQQAQEASRQFGAQQGLSNAQNAAQYGMSAAQLNANQQQFGAQQAATAAQLQAQYGLSAQQAQEAARQFQTNTGMTAAQLQAQYGLGAQQATEASKQFGANLGLQGLQQQINAAQAQGNMGLSLGNQGLGALQQLGSFGQQQQATEQSALDAMRAQFEAERDNPYKMVQYQQSLLQGLPLAAQNYNVAQPSTAQQMLQGAAGLTGLAKTDPSIANLMRSLGFNMDSLGGTTGNTTISGTYGDTTGVPGLTPTVGGGSFTSPVPGDTSGNYDPSLDPATYGVQ